MWGALFLAVFTASRFSPSWWVFCLYPDHCYHLLLAGRAALDTDHRCATAVAEVCYLTSAAPQSVESLLMAYPLMIKTNIHVKYGLTRP